MATNETSGHQGFRGGRRRPRGSSASEWTLTHEEPSIEDDGSSTTIPVVVDRIPPMRSTAGHSWAAGDGGFAAGIEPAVLVGPGQICSVVTLDAGQMSTGLCACLFCGDERGPRRGHGARRFSTRRRAAPEATLTRCSKARHRKQRRPVLGVAQLASSASLPPTSAMQAIRAMLQPRPTAARATLPGRCYDGAAATLAPCAGCRHAAARGEREPCGSFHGGSIGASY